MSNRDDWSELINEVLDAYRVPTTLRMRVHPAGAPTALPFKQRLMRELHNAFVAGQESQKVWAAEADEEFYENQAKHYLNLADVDAGCLMVNGKSTTGEMLKLCLMAAHNRGFEQGRKLIIRKVERAPFHIEPELEETADEIKDKA